MIRTKKAKKVLTKKEQKHLTEVDINSMAALERQIKFMKEENVRCIECSHIHNKLMLDD